MARLECDCGESYRVSDALIGHIIRCRSCKAEVEVTQPRPAPVAIPRTLDKNARLEQAARAALWLVAILVCIILVVTQDTRDGWATLFDLILTFIIVFGLDRATAKA